MADRPKQYIIAGEDTGEMYEWVVTDVWYDEDTEAFYIYSGAGCSCDWAYDEYEGAPPMSELDGPFTFHETLDNIPPTLVDKMLSWERRGKPGTKTIDRW